MLTDYGADAGVRSCAAVVDGDFIGVYAAAEPQLDTIATRFGALEDLRRKIDLLVLTSLRLRRSA